MTAIEKVNAARNEFETATINLIFAICEKNFRVWKRGLIDTKGYEEACEKDCEKYLALLDGAYLDFSQSVFPCIVHPVRIEHQFEGAPA